MDGHHLVEMANQIGNFFSAGPDRTQALLDTAKHLRGSWDPRMREGLYQYVDQHGGAGLTPFLAETVRIHRGLIEPKPRKAPVSK